MTRVFFWLLGVMAIQTFCYADVTKLSAGDQMALWNVSRFREIASATNLPPKVFALCADGNGRLAEPGQDWQETDAIIDDKLPRKRLIWAVTDGDYYVVHYELGGVGKSFHVLVVRLKQLDAKPRFVWRSVGDRLKNYPAFLEALRNGKLDDSSKYNYVH